MTRAKSLAALIIAAAAVGGAPLALAPRAHAGPALPDIEYSYDVSRRNGLTFPGGDAVGYGYAICDKVGSGVSYAQIIREAKGDMGADESDANYVMGKAVGILCPEQILRLRQSAAGYRPAPQDDYSGIDGFIGAGGASR